MNLLTTKVLLSDVIVRLVINIWFPFFYVSKTSNEPKSKTSGFVLMATSWRNPVGISARPYLKLKLAGCWRSLSLRPASFLLLTPLPREIYPLALESSKETFPKNFHALCCCRNNHGSLWLWTKKEKIKNKYASISGFSHHLFKY